MVRILYRFIIIPLILSLAKVFALFNHDINEGLKKRRHVINDLIKWLESSDRKNKRVLFHSASLGEFEHIKPVLQGLKDKYQTLNIITFFSASGYENVKNSDGLDYFSYTPIESFAAWEKFYSILKPVFLVIAKHDVWPGQVWTAQKLGIPVFLVNASLSENSSRRQRTVAWFLSSVYRSLSHIFAISEEDADRFRLSYHLDNVSYLGDTKYDQVIHRRNVAKQQNLLSNKWRNNQVVIVLGSIWPEDEQQIFPALKLILKRYENVKLIIVPHEPNENHLNLISREFKSWDILRFSNRQRLNQQRIILVDQIGFLAGLYLFADFAYVGGSFKQGIHNTMEPAIFGVPVIYGPVHRNSYEAIRLAGSNGGIIINDEKEAYNIFTELIRKSELRTELGQQALSFAERNTGATQKLLDIWHNFLVEQ